MVCAACLQSYVASGKYHFAFTVVSLAAGTCSVYALSLVTVLHRLNVKEEAGSVYLYEGSKMMVHDGSFMRDYRSGVCFLPGSECHLTKSKPLGSFI